MTALTRKFIKSFVFLVGCLFLAISPGFAGSVRQAVYDGQFYPENADELTALIRKYTELAGKTPFTFPAGAILKALILPHAGYVYSGWTAAHASKVLKNQSYKKIIIMGPDHRVGFANCAVSDAPAYETSLGKVLLHPDAGNLRENHSNLFKSVPKSDAMEHCIEVQLPFLQHYLKDFAIVPIVMGPGDAALYAGAINGLLDSETLIVVSSDLSHYLPQDQAISTDRETIRHIVDRDIESLSLKNQIACGIIPIQVLTRLALDHGWQPLLLHYSNSGDTAGPKDSVVGYAAIAYFKMPDTPLQKGSRLMDKKKGELLLKLARKTIADRLHIQIKEAEDSSAGLSDESFTARRGTFVTLKIHDQLRGCIGNLSADKSIIDGVRENAVHAAFDDPRFPPLSKNEFNAVAIEISLLTEPEKLAYTDSADLLNKLRPHVDGVIIKKGPYSATFLPQVWDQLPDKASFLSHLCAKAGLSSDEWRRSGLEVRVYQVQYFEED